MFPRCRYLSAVSFPMAGVIVPGGCADRCVQERGWKHGVMRVRVCGQKKSHNSDEAWFRVEVSVSPGMIGRHKGTKKSYPKALLLRCESTNVSMP